MDPDGDPLGLYLRSLEKLKERLPDDVFVLPGHNLPFVGFSTRADELIAHHEARCFARVAPDEIELARLRLRPRASAAACRAARRDRRRTGPRSSGRKGARVP